jgi:enoyl-CoA hydratase/carnithine racemase
VSQFSTLRLEAGPPIARITLSRADRLNALSAAAMQDLIDAADVVAATGGAKVAIVQGAGRAFCAGFDLEDVGAGPVRERIDLGRRMAEAVSAIPALTIAGIHGHCVGGGVVLAAACDVRIAAEGTRFAIPEVDLGIPLAWGGIPRLVRELGPAITKELVLSCRPFDAAEAHALRFVNKVVPAAELETELEQVAASLARKPELLIRQTKQLVDALVEQSYPTGQSFRDADVSLAALADEESQAAMRRYLEERGRRAPARG